jgi:uncharacterized protein (TIGR03435 family)
MTRALLLVFALPAFGQQATEFEVASIKPWVQKPGASYGACQGGPGTTDPARLTCPGISAATMISFGFGVAFYQIKGPDSLTADRFDVNATVPAGVTKEQLAVLWQSLLATRFHLTAHRESRNSTVYDLVVAKGGSKLIPAAEAAKLPREPPPAVPLIRHVSASSATTDGIARMLAAQLQLPVHNATHLEGAYMFRLGWNSSAYGDPPGPELEEAVREQLGLRLEPMKGTVEIVIVDHIDRSPSEN